MLRVPELNWALDFSGPNTDWAWAIGLQFGPWVSFSFISLGLGLNWVAKSMGQRPISDF
jgi:hypothetical protein